MSSHVTTAEKGRLRDVARINFRFSGDGRYAACLARRGRGHLVPEVWDVADARPRTLPTRAGETSASVPTPTDGGDVLLCRAGADGHRDDDGPPRHPERLNAFDGEVTPLALNPSGRRLALAVNRRTRSHLVLHDLAEDAGAEAGLPAGVIHPAARWNTGGLHLVHSAPDRPAGLVGIAGCSVSRPPAADGETSPARVLPCPGAAGPIEAIVYGDPATSRRVVVALHGGPEAAWRFAHEPLFQRLSGAGIAVVAPNQRGSTGYGAAHRDAIRDAWGGPDLADVLALGHALVAARDPGEPRPMVYGASYGAYLALLACAAQADLWSRAAVVAPFLSGREL
ncbi:alpha/beta hydrolase family protein [Nonomuraea sp. NPDC003560]|uniref:alpha/beta hydrolase family protein n=1 Tax=Nonomuraea sp. NPDC003560 TaxID=3364341 RepID=UPI0036AFB799